MPEIKSDSVRMVFTSPPYWNLKDYDHPGQIGQEDYQTYLERLNSVWEECWRVTKSNGLLIINAGCRRVDGVYHHIAMDIYNHMIERKSRWKLIDQFVWYIPNALPQPAHYLDRLFDNKYEPVLCFAKNYEYDYVFNKIRVRQKWMGVDPRKGKLNPEGRCIGNVLRIPAYRPPPIKKMNYHVSAFPDELVQVFVYSFSEPGDVILDPFVGSGTTLKVSRVLGRRGVGYEINPDLRDTIESRINEYWKPPPFEGMDIIHSSISDAKLHIATVGRRRPVQRLVRGSKKLDEFRIARE